MRIVLGETNLRNFTVAAMAVTRRLFVDSFLERHTVINNVNAFTHWRKNVSSSTYPVDRKSCHHCWPVEDRRQRPPGVPMDDGRRDALRNPHVPDGGLGNILCGLDLFLHRCPELLEMEPGRQQLL